MAFQSLLSQPPDLAATLVPTHILLLHHDSNFGASHSSIYDFTLQLLSTYQFSTQLDDTFLETAQRIYRANPATQPTWRVGREKWYSDSGLTVTATATNNQQETTVAHLHAPIASMGGTRITFRHQAPEIVSNQNQHDLTLTPTTITTRAQGFVKDSVPYLWTPSPPPADGKAQNRGTFSLFRFASAAQGAKRIEIARYRSFSGKYELGGVLVVDERDFGGGVLEVLVTLVGVLGAREGFNRVGAR